MAIVVGHLPIAEHDVLVQRLRLGRPEADQWVELSDARGSYVGFEQVDFVAEAHGQGLEASASVRTFEDGEGLGWFLAKLAGEFRGWDGTRTWTSAGSGLSIEAHSDKRGHVTLRFTIRESYKPSAWEATVSMGFEAGAEMETLANEVVRFLSDRLNRAGPPHWTDGWS